jgi:hypothetical protein
MACEADVPAAMSGLTMSGYRKPASLTFLSSADSVDKRDDDGGGSALRTVHRGVDTGTPDRLEMFRRDDWSVEAMVSLLIRA